MTVNYFAYGSNLLFARLYARTPSIRNLGVAHLHDHRMNFDKPSHDGSGKCGIVETGSGDQVIGVLYRMAKAEKPILDEIEGVGHGYIDRKITVVNGAGVIEAFTYYPTLADTNRQPYDWYKALVLEGARQNNLPKHYVTMIESVDCMIDPDENRRALNYEIIRRVG